MTEFPKRLAEWQSEFSERIVRHGDSPSRLPIKAPAYESGGQKFVGSKDAMVLERWTAGTAGYLRHNGREHVLCFAPALSGKGVGLIVPSLLTWLGSAIVHDIKGENWQLTAGWRARCSRVLLFDPTNPVSAAYNPLLKCAVPALLDRSLAANAPAAQPEGRVHVGSDDEISRRLVSRAAYPSSLARSALGRQIPKVGAGCSNRACPDPCGGCPAMGIPTAIQHPKGTPAAVERQVTNLVVALCGRS